MSSAEHVALTNTPPLVHEWMSYQKKTMSKRILEKWAHRLVPSGREPALENTNEFERVLADATDESPLQSFLASHPTLLSPLSPAGGDFYCLDRPRLGSQWVPDFLLASITSIGFRWTMIELESPNERALTKAGLPAKKLAEAQKQIRDWRTWLTDNVAYAREELGLKDIDAGCQSYVIIGRRASLDPKQVKIYRALSVDGAEVMSYDRLLDTIGNKTRKEVRDGQ
jgi:hypothetical protein